ncbi:MULTISPECIES: hypothetical protein [Burkholderiaceae]|uniref:Mobile element protein n=1 Tax=Caballeronia sordidicola TaxID=196367 RepID=A0A242MBM8_CABSO|nr:MULTISPECIES: hypothetical protein [Burkholderiaceae]OTP68698.1 hypothetical protein PAMC26577_32595 [Caballeronia sordidicola]
MTRAEWLTWHGKGFKAVERLKQIHDMFGLVPEDSAHMALWWNLRGTYWYLESTVDT